MSADVDVLVDEWLTLPAVGERLGLPLPRVKQLLRDGELIAVPRGAHGAPHVPGEFVADGEVVRGLGGTLTLLSDAGYDPEETIRWLCSPEDSLESKPIDLLASGRIKAVRRVAQTLGF